MKRLINICILISIIFPLSGYAQQTYEQFFNQANSAFKEGEYNTALNLLNSAEQLSTTNHEMAAVKNAIGWIYYTTGDYEKARKKLSESLEKAIEAKDVELAKKASNNIGLLEFSQGNLEEAKNYFSNQWSLGSETSIQYLFNIKEQENSQKANLYIAEGVNYRLKKDFEKAVIEYDKALNLFPNNARALEFKGYALFRMGKYNEAIEILEKALSVEPDSVIVIINLLKSHCALNSFNYTKLIIEKNKDLILRNEKIFLCDGELQKVCSNIKLLINNLHNN